MISDPFDDDLQAWCNERLGQVEHWRLAQAADIAAYLARHEDSIRAIDTALPAARIDGAEQGQLEDLSIRSIGEGTSIVVRLVHSTRSMTRSNAVPATSISRRTSRACRSSTAWTECSSRWARRKGASLPSKCCRD